MGRTTTRARSRKARDGLAKVLFVGANQDLLDRLNLRLERRQGENAGIVLSRANVAGAILWDAVKPQGLSEA